ncbi:MAG: ABC transporter ATP-binding protein [Chloroflexota bacterium]
MSSILTAGNLILQRSGTEVFTLDSLVVREGEVLAIIGPNGVGKSTLLLTLAQIIEPLSGEIAFHGNPLNTQDTLDYRRQIAVMLQDPLLLNDTVFNNVATGLRFRGTPRRQIEELVMTWLARLGIDHLRDRSAKRLSGGEAQRVSLARALVLNPELLFLDEPFRALDAPTRAGLLADFRILLADVSMTTLLVTHDLDQALLLADRVAIILEGGLRQCDAPEQVFSAPADVGVANFVGVDTVLPGVVTAVESGQMIVEVAGMSLEAVGQFDLGQQVLFCLRPEDITLWAAGKLPATSARNLLTGRVESTAPQGALVRVVVQCQDNGGGKALMVKALITRNSAQEMEISPGKQVQLTFKASAVHCIPR